MSYRGADVSKTSVVAGVVDGFGIRGVAPGAGDDCWLCDEIDWLR